MADAEAGLAVYHVPVLLCELHDSGAARTLVDVLEETVQGIVLTLRLSLDLPCRISPVDARGAGPDLVSYLVVCRVSAPPRDAVLLGLFPGKVSLQDGELAMPSRKYACSGRAVCHVAVPETDT